MTDKKSNILITGAKGFIGKNLVYFLLHEPHYSVIQFDIENTYSELADYLKKTDVVIHLAGVNRPREESEFETCNVDFTGKLCELLYKEEKKIPVIFSSSAHAHMDNPYGRSKRDAESLLKRYSEETDARVDIYRLKNVFGKWCRPNYNSVVATFCHNIARDLPISISDMDTRLNLVYIDDVVNAFASEIESSYTSGLFYKEVIPSYAVTLGELAETITSFKDSSKNFSSTGSDDEFVKKLYTTYMAYLNPAVCLKGGSK